MPSTAIWRPRFALHQSQSEQIILLLFIKTGHRIAFYGYVEKHAHTNNKKASFMSRIQRSSIDSVNEGPVMEKMLQYSDVIILFSYVLYSLPIF